MNPSTPPAPRSLPLISVALATYNGARHLGAQLASLRAQTWPNLEIVAVDDASGDGTWTTVSASSLSGSFAGSGEESSVEYSFTILLVSDSSEVVARHDPRVVLRKIGGF